MTLQLSTKRLYIFGPFTAIYYRTHRKLSLGCHKKWQRFTKVAIKALSNQLWIKYECITLKLNIFNCGFPTEVSCAFLLRDYTYKWSEFKHFPDSWSEKGFTGTVVNRELSFFHEGPLENTLTVPLICLMWVPVSCK